MESRPMPDDSGQLFSPLAQPRPDELVPDLSQAQRYLQALGGSDCVEFFRALPHATTAKGAQVPKGRRFIGMLADVAGKLIRWNVLKRCGITFTRTIAVSGTGVGEMAIKLQTYGQLVLSSGAIKSSQNIPKIHNGHKQTYGLNKNTKRGDDGLL
jgi:hypothetical protein